MAVVSSHTLNAVDGTHAGGIPVSLTHLPSGRVLFSVSMDDGGRLREEVDLDRYDPADRFELAFQVAGYWHDRGQVPSVEEVVLRFRMADQKGVYHRPVILSPNGYSLWSSGE